MVFTPDDAAAVESSVTDQITGRTPDLTNFIEGSLNETVIDGFSGQMSLYSQTLLHVYLSGFIDYSGKTITEEDLQDLGINPARVNLDFINALQVDADLDALAAANSVSRDPGAYARGEILFTLTSPGLTVDAGVTITTEPDSTGHRLSYITTTDAVADEGATIATAPVEAVKRGSEYNVGSGALSTLPNPPSEVVGEPTNPEAITGGENEESNASLRERARGAMARSSGGGTELGIKGGLETALDGVTMGDVIMEPHLDGLPLREETDGNSYALAIVDYNGTFDNVVAPTSGEPVGSMQELLNELKSFGLGVFYEAPTVFTVDVTATVAPAEDSQTEARAADIDTGRAVDSLISYISTLGLGDDLYIQQVQQAILNSDMDAAFLPSISLSFVAPDGTAQAVTGRHSVSSREKVEPGTISISAVENPSGS